MSRVVFGGFTLWLGGAVLAAAPLAAQGPESPARGIGLELSFGAVSSPGSLGHTSPVRPVGYFHLGTPEALPALGLTVALPAPFLGIRPVARVAWSPALDVAARWNPCPPGAACPSILAEPDSRVGRLEAVLGLERDLPVAVGPVVPGVAVAVGVRRYGLSWEEWGETPGLHLPEGSHAETDLLVEAGLFWALHQGPWTLLTRMEAGWSSYGPGGVPGAGGSVDLGRRSLVEYTVSLGVRRGVW